MRRRLTFQLWLMTVRFVAPALVILVLMQKVGILDADELLHGLWICWPPPILPETRRPPGL